MKPVLQYPLFLIEAAGALIVYGALRCLPMAWSAALGSRVARWIGPLLPLHHLAHDNLRRCYPDADEAWIAGVLTGMWDNLGRTAGEFPHLSALRAKLGSEIELVNIETLDRLKEAGGPAILVSAHLANWELLGLVAARIGLPLDMVYRAPNNPVIKPLFDKRHLDPDNRLIPKGADGARQLMRSVSEKRFIAMLVDQKMNNGIEATFFGQKAMTAPAFAQIALRSRCPLITARIERLEGSRFRITVDEPLELPQSGDREADILSIVQTVNDRLEGWIRERPEQWLWVHRRWPKH